MTKRHRPLNILLINLPNSGSYSGFAGATYFPLGVGYIASVLKEAHHNVKLVDLQSDQSLGRLNDSYLRNLLCTYDYDLLGVGGVFFFISILEKIVTYSREIHPNARIVVGGSFATRNYPVLLKTAQIDITVLGEGEDTILDIVNNLADRKSWKDIAGIAFIEDGIIITTKEREPINDLDQIPFPARDLLPFNVQYKKAFFQDGPGRYCAHIIASRGCPFHCTFCEPTFGRIPRVRSIGNILKEIDFLINHHNVKYFRFYDEMFLGGNKRKVYEFCQEVIKNKLPIFWWCWTNGNLVDREILKLMREAGCIDIAFGLESGSRTILEEMDKSCNLEHHYEMVKYANSIGIRALLSWLTGTFSETDVTLEESKKYYLVANSYQYRPTLIHKIIPLPGTRLFEQAIMTGKIKNAYDYLKLFEEIDAYKEDTWSNIPNLTTISDFDSIIKSIKSEILQAHKKNYSVIRKILSIFGLDHINWNVAFNKFSINDIRPLFEAVVWATLNRKNIIMKKICEIVIFGRASDNGTLKKCEKSGYRG